MHRNTFIFIIILTVLSAIIAGINISNRLNPISPDQTRISTEQIISSPTSSPTPNETNERKQILTYSNPYCGTSVTFDTGVLQFREEASDSAAFASLTDPNDIIVFGCQKDIPKPALSQETMETRMVGSVKATIYHDSSPKDGSKLDALILTNPKNGLDIYIAGYGKNFDTLIGTLTIK